MNYVSVPHGDLGGAGIDALSSEDSIQEGFAEDLINVEASPQGYLSKRAGYQQLFGQLPTRVVAAEFSKLDPTSLRLLLPAHIDLSYIDSISHSRPLVITGKTSKANLVEAPETVSIPISPVEVSLTANYSESLFITDSAHPYITGEKVYIRTYPGGSYPTTNPDFPYYQRPFDPFTAYTVESIDYNAFQLRLDNQYVGFRSNGSGLYAISERLTSSISPTENGSYGISPPVGSALTFATTGTYPVGLDPAQFGGLNPILYVSQRTSQSFRVGTGRPRAAVLNPDTNVFTSPNHGFNLTNTLIMHADVYPTCTPTVGPDTYFQLIPVDADSFKLKQVGGTELDFTTAGSGVYITQGIPQTIYTQGTGTLSYTLTNGDFPSTEPLTHYYSNFKADIRRLVKTGESLTRVLQLEHGLTSPFIQVGVSLSTDDRLLSNNQIWTGGYLAGGAATAPGVTIDPATNDIQIRQTNNTGSVLSELVFWKNKEAVAGSVFISPLPTGDVVNDFGYVRPNATDTFRIGPTGTINHNLLSPKIQVTAYEIADGVYRHFQPDLIQIDSYNTVRITVTNNTDSYRQVFFILTDTDPDKSIDNVSLPAGTSTIEIPDSPSPFMFATCYYATTIDGYPGQTRIIPQSTEYDAETRITTLTFNTSVARTVSVYWEPVSVSINRITLETQIPFSTDFIDTNPQLTVWGLDQSKMYGIESSDRAGWVNHLDSYKSAGTEVLVSGLGGALYSGGALSATERAQYAVPTLYPNLRRKLNSTTILGPLFVEYTAVNNPNGRTNGVIGGTGWGAGLAPITSIQYVDNYVSYIANSTSRVVTVDTGSNRLLTANPFAVGTAIKLNFTGAMPSELYSQDNQRPTYYVKTVTPGIGFTIAATPTGDALTLPAMGPGVLTAEPVRGRVLVTLTDANLAKSLAVYLFKGKDRLLIQDASNSIHAGSWAIDDYDIDLATKTVRFWVLNTEIAKLVEANPEFITQAGGPATLWNCTTGGTCGVFSGHLSFARTPSFEDGMTVLPGDQIVYDTLTDDNPVTVVDTTFYGSVIDGVYQNTTFESQTILTFKRTSDILPLRDSSWLSTTENLITNDNLKLSNYVHQFKVKSINTLDMQYIKSISGDGTLATATLFPTTSTDRLAVGDKLLLTQAEEYSGVITVNGILDEHTFTFESAGTLTCGPFTDAIGATGVVANPATDLFQCTTLSVQSYLPVYITATTMPKVSTDPGAADAFDSTQTYYLQQTNSTTFYLSETPFDGPISFATAGSGIEIRRVLDYKGPVLVGHTVALDDSVLLSDDVNSAVSAYVPGRWIPIEAPEHATSEAPTSYSRYFTNSAYDNQPILRSTEVSDSLFLTNGDDRPVKFDGSSIYRPGLPRWQPQLFFSQSTEAATYDKVQGLISLIKTTVSVTGWARNYFTVSAADVGSFPVGTRIRRSGDATSTYTVIGTKGGGAADTSHQIIVDRTISGTYVSGSSETLTNISTFSYYFRLNAIDANDNIVASAATGAQDCTIVATSNFQNRIRLIGLPALDVYDYDRLEVQIYRTKQNGVAPYYLLTTIQIPFGANQGYIDWVDTKSDDLFESTSQLDPVNTALKGQELGVGWAPPMRSKHVTSAANRLVLGNITSDPYIDLTFRDIGSTVSSSDLNNNRYLLRKSNLDSDVVTDMTNRVGFRFTTQTPASISNIEAITDGFQVTTSAAHGLKEGSWAYLCRPSLQLLTATINQTAAAGTPVGFSATNNLVQNQPIKIDITEGLAPLTTPQLVSGATYYAMPYVGGFQLKTSPTGTAITHATVTTSVTAGITTAAATFSVTPSTLNASFTSASPHNLAVGDAVTMAATTFPSADVAVTVSVATPSVLTSTTAHGFSDGQRIRFTATTYPTGSPNLAPNTDYYVKVLSPTTFNILQVIGGAGLGFSTAGSGVIAKPATVTPFQADTTYYVKEVISTTAFTLADAAGGALKTFYTAGSGITITAPKLQNAIITTTTTPYTVGTAVTFTAGTPPAPLTAGTTYYVVAVSGTATKLASSADGSPVTLTGTGTGTLSSVAKATITVSTNNPDPRFAGWWQVKEKISSSRFTVSWPGRPNAGTFAPSEGPNGLVTAANATFDSVNGFATSTLDVPVYLGTDYNYQVSNGQPSSTGNGIENLATRRLASAINATQRMVNRECVPVYASAVSTAISAYPSLTYWAGPTPTLQGYPERGNVINTGTSRSMFTKISILMRRQGSINMPSSAQVVAVIRKTTANPDSPGALYTSAPILITTIPATGTQTWVNFEFGSPVILESNTEYCIGVRLLDSRITYDGDPTRLFVVSLSGALSLYAPFTKSYSLQVSSTYPNGQITTSTSSPIGMKLYGYPETVYEDFKPWIVANAGSEFAEGQVLLTQPMNQTSTFELVLPDQLGQSSTPSYSVFANGVQRSVGSQVQARADLHPSRVVASYSNFPEIFDAPFATVDSQSDSAIDVNPSDGQEITAVIPFFGASAFGAALKDAVVVVFKTNSIYVVNLAAKAAGQNAVQKIESQGLGCSAPNSVSVVRDGIIFANEAGIFKLRTDLSVYYIGRHLQNQWRSDINNTRLDLAFGHNWAFGSQYKLSVPSKGSEVPDRTYAYNSTREYTMDGNSTNAGREGSWVRHSGFSAIGWCNLEADSFYANTAGQVLMLRRTGEITDWRDDEAPIQMEVLLRSMDFGDDGIRKTIPYALITYRNPPAQGDRTGTVVQYTTDMQDVFETADVTVLANRIDMQGTNDLGGPRIITLRYSFGNKRGIRFQLKLLNATKDENVELTRIRYSVAGLNIKGILQAAKSPKTVE